MDTSALASLFNTAQRTGRLKGYPLLREPTHYTYRETYDQSVATFARTALDTAHPDISALKLVDEDILSQSEDLVTFFRLYATVPATWEEPVSLRIDYPGHVGLWGTVGSWVDSGVTLALDGSFRYVVTKSSHGLVVGQWVELSYKRSLTAYSQTDTLRAPIVAETTNTFTLAATYITASFGTPLSVRYRTLTSVPSRGIRTLSVPGIRRHEYALPGVTAGVANPQAFKPLPELLFVSDEGEPIQIFNAFSTPTNAEWIAAALAGEYFVRESTVQIYRGNILERITDLAPYLL